MKLNTVYDTETFKNYVVFGFKDQNEPQKTHHFEVGERGWTKDEVQKMEDFLQNRTLFGYNSSNFDDWLLLAAMCGANSLALYSLGQALIANRDDFSSNVFNRLLPAAITQDFNVYDAQQALDSVDIQAITKLIVGKTSLKKAEARLGAVSVMDSPLDFSKDLKPEDKALLLEYLENDLLGTLDCVKFSKEAISNRNFLSKHFGINFNKDSDAKIARRLMTDLYEKKTGLGKKELQKLAKANGKNYHVQIPPNILAAKGALSEELKAVINFFENCEFEFDDLKKTTAAIDLAPVIIANIGLQYGVGGIHSIDGPGFFEPDSDEIMLDQDVASQYPTSILQYGLIPAHLDAQVYKECYEGIVKQRLAAKRAGDKDLSAGLKIVINSCFGDFKQKHSPFFDPQASTATCVIGQLSISIAIERLAAIGCRVISANTDGFTVIVKKNQRDLMNQILRDWEKDFFYELEEKVYTKVARQHINSYVAVFDDGSFKTKGLLGIPQDDDVLSRDCTNPIIRKSLMEYLRSGKAPRDTVNEAVAAGAMADFCDYQAANRPYSFYINGQSVGRVIRAYSTTGQPDVLENRKDNELYQKVFADRPTKSAMVLPSTIPTDLDVEWYVSEAHKLIEQVTNNRYNPQTSLDARALHAAGILVEPFFNVGGRYQSIYGDGITSDFGGSKLGVKLGKKDRATSYLALTAPIDLVGVDLSFISDSSSYHLLAIPTDRFSEIKKAILKIAKERNVGVLAKGAFIFDSYTLSNDHPDFDRVLIEAEQIKPKKAKKETKVKQERCEQAVDNSVLAVDKPDNRGLLSFLFGEENVARVHVCTFEGDPDAANWSGGHYGDTPMPLKANNYFAISLFKDFVDENGTRVANRQQANFEQNFVFTIDDVGTKNTKNMQELGLPAPTFTVETSPGNYQYHYKLKPHNNRALLSALGQHVITHGFNEKDPGFRGLNRYVRLPDAYNQKTKHVSRETPDGFACRLDIWEPTRVYTIEELARAVGVPKSLVSEFDTASDTNGDESFTTDNHAFLTLLKEEGLYQFAEGGGWHRITCPWQNEHTKQANTGTKVLIREDGSWVAKCHHGHGQKGFDLKVHQYLVEQGIGDVPYPHTPVKEFQKDEKEELPFKRKGPTVFKVLNPLELEMTTTQWVIKGAIPAGVGICAAAPGVGKTTALSSLALVAAGFGPQIGSDLDIDFARNIYYFSEDTTQVFRLLETMSRKYGIDREQMYSRISLVNCSRQDPKEVAAQLAQICQGPMKYEMPLAIFDTSSSNFKLEENNNDLIADCMSALKSILWDENSISALLVCHPSKATAGGYTVDPRGASALKGDAHYTMSFCAIENKANDERTLFLELLKNRVTATIPVLKFTSSLHFVSVKDLYTGNYVEELVRISSPQASSKKELEFAKENCKEDLKLAKTDNRLDRLTAKFVETLNENGGVIGFRHGTWGKSKLPDELADVCMLNWNDYLGLRGYKMASDRNIAKDHLIGLLNPDVVELSENKGYTLFKVEYLPESLIPDEELSD